jgi:hypothetical protein
MPIVAWFGHGQIEDAYLAAAGADQARNQAQYGGLAAARGADQRDEFVAAQMQVHALQGRDRAAIAGDKGLGDRVQIDYVLHGRRSRKEQGREREGGAAPPSHGIYWLRKRRSTSVSGSTFLRS